MISDERLEFIANRNDLYFGESLSDIAKELLALRKAFETPDCWEIAGNIFPTEADALKPRFIGTPEPLYSKPEVPPC